MLRTIAETGYCIEPHAQLASANLSSVDLSYADLRWANLADADLDHADLTGALLTGTDLRWTDLRHAVLELADLRWADLRWATLSSAKLAHATLTHANLQEATLTNADVTGVDLIGTVFAWTELTGVDLTTAKLNSIKHDLWALFAAYPHTVSGIYQALAAGRIDATETIDPQSSFLKMVAALHGDATLADQLWQAKRPIEVWMNCLCAGDTPLNHPIAAITNRWIEEWLALPVARSFR